jgi:hypothetical protein
MEAYGRLEAERHLFFNLGTRWRLVASFEARSLYSRGKRPDTH